MEYIITMNESENHLSYVIPIFSSVTSSTSESDNECLLIKEVADELDAAASLLGLIKECFWYF